MSFVPPPGDSSGQQQGYGAPPPGYGGAPPGGYGAPPPQQGSPYPGAPSPGYSSPPQAGGLGYPGGPQGGGSGYPTLGEEVYGAPIGIGGGTGGYPPNVGAPGGPGYPGDEDRGFGKLAAGGAAAYGLYHHHQGQHSDDHHAPPVVPPPSSTSSHHDHHHGAAAAGVGAAGGAGLAFFNHLNNHEQRNYVLVVDRSVSMTGNRWKQAGDAVAVIAPHICHFDPDGVTLYLFESHHKVFEGVKDAHSVQDIFRHNPPTGGTNLADVLSAAFQEHFKTFQQTRRPTTILVVTDGAPDSKEKVKNVIRDTTHYMSADPELSVSFIQIGDDIPAQQFLKELDDRIQGCKFDIVDTVKASDMKNKSFAELVEMSIRD